MFGNGVWTYIMLPITSGEPSWPRSTPVEKVQATWRCLTLSLVDLVELRIARVGVVHRLHRVLFRIARGLDHRVVRDRRHRNSGEESGGNRQ